MVVGLHIPFEIQVYVESENVFTGFIMSSIVTMAIALMPDETELFYINENYCSLKKCIGP